MPINNNLNRVISFWLIFCVLVSLYAYLGDCVLNFTNAIQNIKFLPLYLLIHSTFKIYLILPLIVLYYIIFQRCEKRYSLKALFLISMGIFLEHYFRPDEISLTIGEFRTTKQIAAYVLGGLTTFALDEFYLKKIKKSNYPGNIR